MSAESSVIVGRNPREQATAAYDRSAGYELWFAGLFNPGRGFAFPCDADGQVNIDSLNERARANYFYARTVIGREFHAPVTCQVAAACNAECAAME
jgi:hypothetical protein